MERGRTQWLKLVRNYRNHCRLEALQKHQTLSYNFYLNIYCRPHMAYHDLTSLLKQVDINPTIIDIPNYARSGMIYLFERMTIVNQSSVHQWWWDLHGNSIEIRYIFWDDFWRRNFKDIGSLRKYEEDFSPAYPSRYPPFELVNWGVVSVTGLYLENNCRRSSVSVVCGEVSSILVHFMKGF